ncbi:ATP-binding protein [Aquincola sp. MAHUQ-54]|uniref:histidine kinase n=1 Tax=Aquincola agrisoli TaxID=3119538 RepID=A0AAW9Q861_9BURK
MKPDHIRALIAQSPASLTGNAVGFGVMVGVFLPLASPMVLGSWLGAVIVLWLLRLGHWWRYRQRERAGTLDDATLSSWYPSYLVLVLMQGAQWGAAVWLFWDLGTPYHRLALILVSYAYTLGAVQLLVTQGAVFNAFISLVLLPTILRIATDASQPFHWQLAVVLGVIFVATLVIGRTHRSALEQAITLKARTDQLAAQLRIEKAAADAARSAAEAASRAKTQFFAAASHDLRQPLHAMGLFAEALRQRIHDPEVASLVNSINESVDALEGLFGELLDITRIDSGGVEVNPHPVRMKELFTRLRLHFEPLAFEKGLALSFHGERHVAHTDPLLLERILRNLVSNAIRYTEDGGVLVSCRRRGGRLLVQVWDSGIGVSEAALPRIFDEFYQVHTSRPLEAHHRKGLGLGLAIVKRLADLLQAPLRVQSRVDRGTVFTMELPAGIEQRRSERDIAPTKAALGLTLNGRRMVVVEDEAAVREGLVVLLQAWGAQVEAFETVDAVRAWVVHAGTQPPDLLIVDYRLPAGTTGLDALAVLRARWPQASIPAIVVTGSSLGGHEDESSLHDFHLLIKPVLPNKLRAMIAFKLGMR